MKNTLVLYMIFAALSFCRSIYADSIFLGRNGEEIRLSVVRTVDDMDLNAAKNILVKSFMTAYEDVPLADLNPEFQSIGDVRRFYEHYFEEELHHFQNGGLIWIQAFVNEQLAGWATFEIENSEPDAAYMNLLAVAPEYQGKGVGGHLVFSIRSEELFPNIRAINLLLRRVNQSGYQFYRELGFAEFDYVRDNFVDPALLIGLRWQIEF